MVVGKEEEPFPPQKAGAARTFLVLDLSLDVLDGVGGLHLEGDGLPRQSLHKNLHLELLLFPAKTNPKKKRRKITRKSEEKKKFQKLCPQRLE